MNNDLKTTVISAVQGMALILVALGQKWFTPDIQDALVQFLVAGYGILTIFKGYWTNKA
jgi:hypothetical protein